MGDTSSINNKTWLILAILAAGLIFGVGPFRNAQCKREKKEKTNPFYEQSFTGKYSDTEISRLKDEVQKCEYEVNLLASKVHSHENMVNNADTKNGHENGNYANEVSQLNRIKSEYNDAIDRLNSAKSKLNEAL